jgi:hypothetical protein
MDLSNTSVIYLDRYDIDSIESQPQDFESGQSFCEAIRVYF